jgi:hypothetical protein
MVPRVRDHSPLGTKKMVSLLFEKEWARRGPSGKPQTFKIKHHILFNRRNMAQILNNKINQSIKVKHF